MKDEDTKTENKDGGSFHFFQDLDANEKLDNNTEDEIIVPKNENTTLIYDDNPSEEVANTSNEKEDEVDDNDTPNKEENTKVEEYQDEENNGVDEYQDEDNKGDSINTDEDETDNNTNFNGNEVEIFNATSAPRPDESSILGDDKDSFGCILSAGYKW